MTALLCRPCYMLLAFLLALFVGAAPVRAADPVQVVIRGVEDEALKNVQAALEMPPGMVREGQVDRRWLERFADHAQLRVSEALRPFGFYNTSATAALEEMDPGQRYRLIVTVTPGEPVLLRQARVAIEGDGCADAALLQLAAAFPLQSGDVLRQDHYEKAKGELKARALDRGYLDAHFTSHRILIDPEANRARIELVLETGPRYLFGTTLIHGAPDFPDRFLRRYMAYKPETPFSYARLGQTQLNFLDSDRFREVVVTPRLEMAEERRVPVNIRLIPSARRRLRPGIGYGTDTGARFSLQYKDVNLLRRGQELTADFLVAELRQDLGAAWVVPSYHNLNSHTSLRAGLEREDPGTYDRSTLFVEVERVRGFHGGMTGSVYLRLLQEDFTVGEEDDRSFMVLPGVRFNRRSYNDPVRPRRGYLINLEVRGTHQTLGSGTGLLQTIASGNVLVPLPARFTLFLRLQGGATWQNEPLREVPPSLRFFAGGDRSVRGYGYQDLGPRDANDDVVGGKNLLVGSIEVERALGENWGVALFYDAGNAFDSFSEYEIFEGAGIGVGRYTPVGPIRLNLARQIGVPDPSYRLHVSVGFAW